MLKKALRIEFGGLYNITWLFWDMLLLTPGVETRCLELFSIRGRAVSVWHLYHFEN